MNMPDLRQWATDETNRLFDMLYRAMERGDHLAGEKPDSEGLSPTDGMCYIASEVMSFLLGADRVKPCTCKVMVHGRLITHWYLVDRQNASVVYDPTAEQFKVRGVLVRYDLGQGRGFLTKTMSRRAQELLALMPTSGPQAAGVATRRAN